VLHVAPDLAPGVLCSKLPLEAGDNRQSSFMMITTPESVEQVPRSTPFSALAAVTGLFLVMVQNDWLPLRDLSFEYFQNAAIHQALEFW
jgi:hypothetical protein